MPKNNCKQCETNGKWRILGTDCSQAIFDSQDDCENYKEGYGQTTEKDELSNFDLLFGGGTQVELPEYGDEDYISEGEIDPLTGLGGDSDVIDESQAEGEEDEINETNDGLDNSSNSQEVDENGWPVDPDEPEEGCPDTADGQPQIWNSFFKRCEPTVIDEEGEDDEEEDEEDNPCFEKDCGPTGVCVDGICTCPEEGYELDPTTGRCVTSSIADDDENNDINKFTVPGGYTLSGSAYEVPENQEKSVLALAMSFNPTHTKNWTGQPNPDLPVFIAGHIQPGDATEDDLEGEGYGGKDAKINPILHEMFCGGNPKSPYKSSIMDYGGKPWSDKTCRGKKGNPLLGYNENKDDVRGKHCFPKDPASRSNRWGQCNVHNTVGTSGGSWLFCAYGITCTADLFVMKYWSQISAGSMPGGQQSWIGSTGAPQMVKLNARKTSKVVIGYFDEKSGRGYKYTGHSSLKNCIPFKSKYKGSPKKAAGPMLDTQKNRDLLTKLGNFKGAIFCHFGHIGMVVGVIGKSHPPTASFLTLEFNVGAGLRFQRHPFMPAAQGTRTRSGVDYHITWLMFADTTPLLGGSWAPKGLANTEYLEGFLGKDYMKYFNDGGQFGKKFEKICTSKGEWSTKDPYAKGFKKDFSGVKNSKAPIVNNNQGAPTMTPEELAEYMKTL